MGDTLVRMPKLADTLVEGTLGRWLKQVGDTVGQGEPLASIETDKVTTDLTSPAAGTLQEILVAEGQTVAVDTVIARIGEGSPSAAASVTSPPSTSPVPSPSPVPSTSRPPTVPSSPAMTTVSVSPASPVPSLGTAAASPPKKATPVAARLLAEHGLRADQIPSPSGRLTKDDGLEFIRGQAPRAPQPVAPAAGVGELTPLTSMRRAIAEHMTRAHRTIPQGQSVMAADLTRLVAWREQYKSAFLQTEGANLTFTVLFVFALAHRLAFLNRTPADLGVAVALDAGLIVPVVRGADSLTLGETARGITDLATRARQGKLTPGETQGAQMTVTNVGSFGNLTASPIVPLGQIGILGPGLVEQRPLPGPDHGIRLGWRCLISLMFDRRALDELSADRLLRGVVDELARIPGPA